MVNCPSLLKNPQILIQVVEVIIIKLKKKVQKIKHSAVNKVESSSQKEKEKRDGENLMNLDLSINKYVKINFQNAKSLWGERHHQNIFLKLFNTKLIIEGYQKFAQQKRKAYIWSLFQDTGSIITIIMF